MKLTYTVTATNNGAAPIAAVVDIQLQAEGVDLPTDDFLLRDWTPSLGSFDSGTMKWTVTVAGGGASETLQLEIFAGREITDGDELACIATEPTEIVTDTELTDIQNTWTPLIWLLSFETEAEGTGIIQQPQKQIDADAYPHDEAYIIEPHLWWHYSDFEEQTEGDPKDSAQVYDASNQVLPLAAFVEVPGTTYEAETLSHDSRVTGKASGVLKNINRVNDEIVALKGAGDYTGAYLLLLSDGGAQMGAEFVYEWLDFSPDQNDLAAAGSATINSSDPRFEGDPAVRFASDEPSNGPPGFGQWDPKLWLSIADFCNVASGTIEIDFKLKDVTGVKALLTSADEAGTNYFGVFVNATKIEIRRDDGSETISVGTTVLSADTWYSLKIISNGTAYTVTLDGGSETVTNNDGDWFGDVSGRDNVAIGVLRGSSESGKGGVSLDKVYVY